MRRLGLRAGLVAGILAMLLPAASAGAAGPLDDAPAPGLPVLGDVSSVVLAVPINTFAPPAVPVDRASGLKFANLDANRHDVVALEATRPDGSADWCERYDAGECPLFWSPLIPGGGSVTPVEGLEDAEAGASYTFYCSIHPYMTGTIEVLR